MCIFCTVHREQSSSIYTEELYVILKVIQLIENSNHRNFTILTDSKSAMLAIADIYSNYPILNKIQSRKIWPQTRHITITFC